MTNTTLHVHNTFIKNTRQKRKVLANMNFALASLLWGDVRIAEDQVGPIATVSSLTYWCMYCVRFATMYNDEVAFSSFQANLVSISNLKITCRRGKMKKTKRELRAFCHFIMNGGRFSMKIYRPRVSDQVKECSIFAGQFWRLQRVSNVDCINLIKRKKP